MPRRVRLVAGMAVLVAVLVAALVFTPFASGKPAPFGHSCDRENGVRFCPTPDSAHRVPSFDGIPLDVDVTLPARGGGPFPTIVMLHGYGGSKTDFESSSPAGPDPNAAGAGSQVFHYNNDFYARRGYAVLNYTARGFGNSCGGGPGGDHSGACGKGYIRLADTRYEARDTQYLLGLLADQGIVKPKDIGVTGISYGGGQSMELAFLRNKIRKRSGKLAPWRSPKGRRMAIRAAYPRWPWSDLVDALLPNGRFRSGKVAPLEQSLNPVGVPIQSYISGLYALGQSTGYYCGTAPASTPCADRDANLPLDLAEIQAGQPLNADALSSLKGVYRHSSAYALRFVRGHSRPAPLLIENGWTDDLFPPEQALRVYRYLRSRSHDFPVSLQFGDLGHSRGSNKPGLNHYFNNQGARFFAAHLKGGATPRLLAPSARSPRPARSPSPTGGRSRRGAGPRFTRIGSGSGPGGADVHLRGRRSVGCPGLRPDRRHLGRVQDDPADERAQRGHLPAKGDRRPHDARAADGSCDHRRHGSVRADRRAPVGPLPGGHPEAGQSRRLQPHLGPERTDHLPAPRQRLSLRGRTQGAARIARPRLPVLPGGELPVHRQRFQAHGHPAAEIAAAATIAMSLVCVRSS